MMNKSFIFYLVLSGLLIIPLLSCSTHNAARNLHASDLLQFDHAQTLVDTGEYAHIVPPPDQIPTTQAGVYIESIQKVTTPDTAFLIVKGNFANGCAKLASASHTIENRTLYLHLEAWQPANRICTQMLSPFTFPYRSLSRQQIDSIENYVSGGTRKAF